MAGGFASLLLCLSPLVAQDAARDATRVEGRTVAEWTAALKSPVEQVRRHACWAFTKFGDHGAAALPDLIAALDDKSSSVRLGAANALGALGPAAAPAIPKLIEKLDDLQDCLPFTQPIEEVRKQAAVALARIGAASVPALVEALASEKKTLRIGAALALEDLENERAAAKPAVPPLRTLLLQNDIEQRLAAALALVVLDPPAPVAAAFLTSAARSEDVGAAAVACGAFEKLGAAGVGHLEPLLDVANPTVRMLVASSLVNLDPKHAAALAVLEEGARSEKAGDAAIALEALGRARGAAAVPIFRAALASPDAEARITAAILLFVHDPGSRDAKEASAALDGALTNPDDAMCRFAIRLFGERAGQAALSRLEAMLKHERRTERVAAAAALLEIDCNHAAAAAAMDAALQRYVDPEKDAKTTAKTLTPADEQRLRDEVARFAKSAAKLGAHRARMRNRAPGDDAASYVTDDAYPEFERAMMALIKEGPVATPYLQPLLDDGDPAVRYEAAALLFGEIPADPRPLRILVDSLNDPELEFSSADRLAIVKRPEVAAALRAALAGASAPQKLPLARTLLRVEPGAKEALLALFDLLQGNDEKTSRIAASALADALAKDATGDVARRLQELLTDPATSSDVRFRCAELVVGKLGGDDAAKLRAKRPELVATATELLQRSCKEGSPHERLNAAKRLVEASRRDPVALATLVELLGADPETADSASFALLEYGESILLQLTRLVLDASVELPQRARAAFAIGGMGGIAVSAVRKILKEGEPEIRRQVLEFADHWEERESMAQSHWRRLGGAGAGLAEPRSTRLELAGLARDTLKDADPRVRAVAAEKLFDLDHTQKSWAEALDVALAALDAVGDDACFEVGLRFRRIAWWTGGVDMEMRSTGSERERKALHARLVKELEARIVDPARNRAHRSAAALALATDERAIDRSVALAASDDSDTRRAVAFGLGYASGYPDPRPAAVAALGKLLDAAPSASDPWIALNAARSLLRLLRDMERAKLVLQQLAQSSDAQLAGAARQALAGDR